IAGVIAATAAEHAEIAGRIVLIRARRTAARPAVAEVDAAADLARAAAPIKVLPELLLLRARLMLNEAGPEGVWPVVAEALAAARQTGDADLIADVMWAGAFMRYQAAEIGEMRRLLDEAHEHVNRTGSKR